MEFSVTISEHNVRDLLLSNNIKMATFSKCSKLCENWCGDIMENWAVEFRNIYVFNESLVKTHKTDLKPLKKRLCK